MIKLFGMLVTGCLIILLLLCIHTSLRLGASKLSGVMNQYNLARQIVVSVTCHKPMLLPNCAITFKRFIEPPVGGQRVRWM